MAAVALMCCTLCSIRPMAASFQVATVTHLLAAIKQMPEREEKISGWLKQMHPEIKCGLKLMVAAVTMFCIPFNKPLTADILLEALLPLHSVAMLRQQQRVELTIG